MWQQDIMGFGVYRMVVQHTQLLNTIPDSQEARIVESPVDKRQNILYKKTFCGEKCVCPTKEQIEIKEIYNMLNEIAIQQFI